jgi:peptidoglycan L-alanyl-D-glutamate endopeptidase CwlK
MFGNDVLFLQRFLKSAGCYGGALTGLYDTATGKALAAFENESNSIAHKGFRFDQHSEHNIVTLTTAAQIKAREFMAAAQAVALDGAIVKIICGTRTYAEQADIYAQGRSRPGRIVTRAGPGESDHNFGIAWDIGVFKDGAYLDQSPLYKELGKIGKSAGLEWGGDWSGLIDQPHYQLRTWLSLAQVRQRFEAGAAYV